MDAARSTSVALLEQWARRRLVAPEQVYLACGEVGQADGERMLRRCCEPDRLGFVRGRFLKSAELGKARLHAGFRSTL